MRIWAWPIFVFAVLFLFRSPIGELISRLHSVASKIGTVTFELKKIQQDLPSLKLNPDPAVKGLRRSLDLSTRAVERIIPTPLSECAEDISDETMPLIVESNWQRLMGFLKHLDRETQDKPKTLPDFLEALNSSRRIPAHVARSILRLADVRQRLRAGADPVDAATVAAFIETVERIIFTIHDHDEFDFQF